MVASITAPGWRLNAHGDYIYWDGKRWIDPTTAMPYSSDRSFSPPTTPPIPTDTKASAEAASKSQIRGVSLWAWLVATLPAACLVTIPLATLFVINLSSEALPALGMLLGTYLVVGLVIFAGLTDSGTLKDEGVINRPSVAGLWLVAFFASALTSVYYSFSRWHHTARPRPSAAGLLPVISIAAVFFGIGGGLLLAAYLSPTTGRSIEEGLAGAIADQRGLGSSTDVSADCDPGMYRPGDVLYCSVTVSDSGSQGYPFTVEVTVDEGGYFTYRY